MGLFLALAFTAVPARAGDNAAFVSYSGVPPRLEPGGKATVTVRMLNTGTTTWRTSVVEETSGGTKTTTRTSFSLDSVGDDWGVQGVPVTGSVAPNAPRSFRFTITAPSKRGSYTFQWRMARNTFVTERPIIPAKPGEGFGARTDAMTILVEPDESPSFKGTVDDQEWLTGRAISPVVTLPDAMGGNGALSYALSCALPPGVTFNDTRRRISGTPSREWPRKTCRWKATDVDGDTDTETFTISAKRPVLILEPTKLEVEEGESKTFTVKLAARPQGNVTVSLSSADAEAADVDHTSLTFNTDNYGRTQEVTVEGKQDKDRDNESTNIRLRASGGGYDRVTASLPVAVTDDDTEPPPPELPPVDDQVWPKGKPVSETLPAATGGTPPYTYGLSPDPPLPGVTFNPSTRILSGTPTQARDAVDYIYTVTDAKNKEAFRKFTIGVAVLVVSPASLEIAEGGSGTFNVKLAAKPKDSVVVSVTSRDTGAVSMAAGLTSLTFTETNYSRTQTVTVNGVQDTDASDETTIVDLSASGGGYEGVSATAVVNVDDDEEPVQPGLVVNPASLTIKEGETAEFTVKLATQPTAGVTVSVTSANTGVASVNKGSLTFSRTGYGKEETVTVTGKRNPPGDTTRINLRAKGGNYAGITKSVPVTIDGAPSFSERASNQVWERGRRVSVTLPVATGGNGTLRYALSRPWPAGVTFNDSTRVLSGTPTTLQTATTYTYTVTDSDGNRGSSDRATQTFTIEVVEPDPDPDPDPNTSPVFSGKVPAQKWTKDKAVSVTLPGATGGEGALTYKLTPKPPDGVTFDPLSRLLSGKPTATQSATTYTYTAGDSDDDTSAGDTARQSFTITVALPDTAPEFTEQAPDRHWVTGQAIGTVTLPAAAGGNGDLTYGLSPDPPDGVTFDSSARTLSGRPTAAQAAVTYTYTAADADANTEDGDTATQTFSITVRRVGLLLSETELAVDEGVGGSAFTVKLASQPTAGVTVEVASSDPGAVEATPARLTFTAVDYGEPRPVTVAGVPDPGFEDETTKVGLRAIGGGYDGVVKVVTVTVDDDDVDTVPELAGEFDALEWLAGRAIDPVVLPAGTGGNAPLTYSLRPDPPDGVTFDPATRTLSGIPTTPQAATTYTYTAADSDENTSETDAAAAEFTITVKQPALVSSKASLALLEGGAGGTFTAKLAARPKSDVTVSLKSGDAGAASVNPASLTFTAANHNVARTVTVQGVEDHDFDDETTEITLTAAGGGYDGETATVSVTVDDDETDTAPSFDGQAPDREWTADRPITTVTLPEATGGNGELTYTLSPDPPEGVVFDPGTRTLTGTPKSPQDPTEYTWKATDADRNTADGDAASQTFTITVKRLALVLSTTRLELKEGETDQTLTVKLGSPPTEDVTVSLAMDREIVTTDPRQLIFTPTNHAAPRTVTAKGAQDDDFDDETAEITLTAVGGGYDGETATVTVTVDDDETDTAPAFNVEIDDIEWIANRAFEPFALPEASGGNGDLTYALSPEPPASVTFDPATRTLSGTPTGTQDPTLYTYTATDADGNTDAADAATLTFTIEVWLEGLDDAAFVSQTGVPEVMLAGDRATVTVRMRNTGRTTWRSASYRLGSQRPQDNEIWGLARVALPADVAPDETVDLTFAITAPAEVGSHKFRWRMVRGAAGWFGGKTELSTIAVEDPSFLGREIPDQTWVKDETVVSLTLPEARGAGGALTYSLKPALPDGVTFTETTRVLAGTPTTVREATEYRYIATDAGGKKAKLTFEIAVEEGVIDDAAVVSVTGLPSKMAAGGKTTVTVTMTNTGTTTWSSPAGYGLGSWDRSDKDRWGVRRAAAPGSVAPNETADFTFDVTAPEKPGVHPFTWRMVRDPGGWFGAHTADVSVTVEDPSFGDEAVADQTWMQGEEVDALVLPAAGGTAGPFGYAISPDLPDGVTFAESTRTVSGTPEAAQAATRYSYTATDTDGGTATLSFGITVEALAMDDAAFVSQTAVPEKMAAGAETVVTVRMRNTGTTTWTSEAGYALGSQRPDDNERWGLKRVSPPADVAPDATVDFAFTITAPTDVGRHGFRWRMVRGADGWFGRKTDLRTIEVEDPSFGDAAIGDQKWAKDAAIATLLLHEADGTAGPFTYSLTPDLPDGVTFDGSNRTISGRPTAVLEETEYAYTATAANGGTATLTFMVTVSEHAVAAAAAQGAASAPPPSSGVAFEFRNGGLGGSTGSDGAAAAASAGTPGWTADSGDATISRVPTGLAAPGQSAGAGSSPGRPRRQAGRKAGAPTLGGAPGDLALRLRGSDAGGDEADDAVVTEQWIPVEGGTYRLSACMLRENARDNVFVDFDGGAGRDGDFPDAHIVATETGTWECGAVTKCIPDSVGAVRVRAVREGANLGDAWFDRIEMTRLAACGRRGANQRP